jgi:hypothetical protein
MRKASAFWAAARNAGRQSADAAALDADMILAAQSTLLNQDGNESMTATTNVRHLGCFHPRESGARSASPS